jgi:hypothetical protein
MPDMTLKPAAIWGNVGKISISGAPRERQDGQDADSQLD